MIIECINCNKKFEVNSELIPPEGRTIQCGSCNFTWFFDKKNTLKPEPVLEQDDKISPISFKKNDTIKHEKKLSKKDSSNIEKIKDKKTNIKGSELIKYKSKSSFSLGGFLSYILVALISFIGLVVFIDTFKSQLYVYFPRLEILLFSLYETLKDIQLFIKDLI
tara:strand:+ start:89 stop:580 length:492 start_codon:yes stop_codon:yes gene_type:complete